MMRDFIYTIGHSNHAIETFMDLLTAHGVTAVADVRSHPYSRYTTQFNRESLQARLKAQGLGYVFLGRELGARTDDPGCYAERRVEYDLLACTPAFREGLSRLTRGASDYRIALMCAEKDPLTCHRSILVCRHLTANGIGVQHILEDGRIETHDAALDRLLAEEGLAEPDLFRSREEMILDAYGQRARQIAYRHHETSEEGIAGGPST